MSEKEPAEVDVGASLVGAPVDPRRPPDMSRRQYMDAPPGVHTKHGLEAAGLSARKRFIIISMIGVALALGAGLMFWLS